MLGRAKNLIQAVLLITGNVLTSHFTLWRVTGGVGERPGAVLVHVLFSASGDFCCCAFSCFSILHKIWKLVLQLWPRRSSQCSVTHQHQTDLVMNEGEFWALGQGCWGCFAAFRACWALGDWALSGFVAVATKSVISHCDGPGNLWLSAILFSFGGTLT